MKTSVFFLIGQGLAYVNLVDPFSADVKKKWEELESAETYARNERLAAAHVEQPLPSWKEFFDLNDYNSTFKWIFERSKHTDVNFEDFLKEQFGSIGQQPTAEAKKLVDETVSEFELNSKIWRKRLEEELDFTYKPEDLKSRAVLDDVALVIPLGHKSMLRTWTLIEGLLTSSMLPGEILLTTGIMEEFKGEHLDLWISFHNLIQANLLPFLPDAVELKWAVYSGKGGASVSRRMAIIGSTKDIVFNFDADDYLAPHAIYHQYQYLKYHPRVDYLLGGYHLLNSSNITSEENPDAAVLDMLFDRMSENLKHVADNLSDGKLIKDDNRVSENEKLLKEEWSNWFEPGEKSKVCTEFKKGSLVGLPNLHHIRDCRDMLSNIMNREREEGEYDLDEELESFQYLQKVCLATAAHGGSDLAKEISHYRYVYMCHNGWLTARRSVLELIPASEVTFGEDSLLTYMAKMLGFNVVCDNAFRGGMYMLIRAEVLGMRYAD